MFPIPHSPDPRDIQFFHLGGLQNFETKSVGRTRYLENRHSTSASIIVDYFTFMSCVAHPWHPNWTILAFIEMSRLPDTGKLFFFYFEGQQISYYLKGFSFYTLLNSPCLSGWNLNWYNWFCTHLPSSRDYSVDNAQELMAQRHF